MDALEALQSYQNGEDGLSQTIKKNTELHSKIQSRDKQIRALVMELNALQDEAQENIVLRYRRNFDKNSKFEIPFFVLQKTSWYTRR